MKTLKIKFAGGAAAQCLALMNAIYLRNKLNRNFVLKYYPYSTGTFWPLSIDFLLRSGEIEHENGVTKGLDLSVSFVPGSVIPSHPLSTRSFSYEKLLVLMRKIGLEAFLQGLRGEKIVRASLINLERVGSRTKSASGGFVPILDERVMAEMHSRFKNGNRLSPFEHFGEGRQSKIKIALHYRIGDKRSKFLNPNIVGNDGVMDPIVFKNLIESSGFSTDDEVKVFSDSPELAMKLLEKVGINATTPQIGSDIWDDLYEMSQSELFIGSWSQVSQLAALCVASGAGKVCLPNPAAVGLPKDWAFVGLDFYEPIFLPQEHEIYF